MHHHGGMPTSEGTTLQEENFPTTAAITLWPQAWPMPGRQSYSAQSARCSGPLPARATNGMGKSHMPPSTVNPAPLEPGSLLLFKLELRVRVDTVAQIN